VTPEHPTCGPGGSIANEFHIKPLLLGRRQPRRGSGSQARRLRARAVRPRLAHPAQMPICGAEGHVPANELLQVFRPRRYATTRRSRRLAPDGRPLRRGTPATGRDARRRPRVGPASRPCSPARVQRRGVNWSQVAEPRIGPRTKRQPPSASGGNMYLQWSHRSSAWPAGR
jgi:hypothetical protein